MSTVGSIVTYELALLVSTIVFVIAIAGLYINKKNLIMILLCIELILLAVNLQFLIFAKMHSDILGQIMVLFILTIAAAETSIGLAIIILIYRSLKSIDVEKLNNVKEY